MGRRASILMLVAALVLGCASVGLVGYVYRSARGSVEDLLRRRLEAVGATGARLIAEVHYLDGALADVASANQLDAAYVVDERMMMLADAHGHAGRRANLLRLDADRARAALAGSSSVGWAYDVEGTSFLGGYFPVPAAPTGQRRALVLEAGETFAAPSRRLRVAAGGALAVGGALFALSLAGVAFAARAARRERDAYGRAERAGLASRMAAMVAHEVRNPLGIIRGGAELLRERIPEPRDRELVDDILGEVERLNALTEEFLTLGRDQPLHLADVQLEPLARAVCDAVSVRYRERALRFEVRGDATVHADEAKLRQVLLNLVLNAAQAGGGETAVRIETDRVDGLVRLRVADDGPGVPPERVASLFEPFATTKVGGSGLGLAVARRILERHGGTLVYAPEGRGACFEARLPPGPEEVS